MADGPYLEQAIIEAEVAAFVEIHGAVFVSASWKMSAFFEASCYNQIIGWYASRLYAVEPKQVDPKTGEFRYKVSPPGYPESFSYFTAVKAGAEFEIRMNTAVQSEVDPTISITPDIVVLEPGGIAKLRDAEYYRGRRDYVHVQHAKVVTFYECKHMNGFPELFTGFFGMLHQLRPRCVGAATHDPGKGAHLAPGLLLSGVGDGYMAARVGRSLMSRHCMNISTDMFRNRTPFAGSKNEWGIEWRVFGKAAAPVPIPRAPVTAPPHVPDFSVDDTEIPF